MKVAWSKVSAISGRYWPSSMATKNPGVSSRLRIILLPILTSQIVYWNITLPPGLDCCFKVSQPISAWSILTLAVSINTQFKIIFMSWVLYTTGHAWKKSTLVIVRRKWGTVRRVQDALDETACISHHLGQLTISPVVQLGMNQRTTEFVPSRCMDWVNMYLGGTEANFKPEKEELNLEAKKLLNSA